MRPSRRVRRGSGPVTTRDAPAAEGFEGALRSARRGRVDLPTALVLFRGAASAAGARALFDAAAQTRDASLGRQLELTAHLHMVTPCELWPPCRYCSLSSSLPRVRAERSELSMKSLIHGALYATARGVRSIMLVGGTNPDGSDEALREVVSSVRRVTELPLAIDVGPSLSPETVDWLSGQDVRTVYGSIETANPRVFHRAKPGDDLDARLAFDAMLGERGMRLGNVVMNGLGRTEDLLASVLSLRRFRTLSHLYISTFQPVRGTPWARRRPATVRTSLKALAIARLAMPKVHLGLAEVEVEDPGSSARAASQLAAGAGNSIAGLLIYGNRRVDHLEQIRQEAAAAGFAS